MEKKLTQEEFYAGLGLFLLASKRREELDKLQVELEKILRKHHNLFYDKTSDWVGDFIYDDREATFELFLELLDRLAIEVKDETNAELLLRANEETKNVEQG